MAKLRMWRRRRELCSYPIRHHSPNNMILCDYNVNINPYPQQKIRSKQSLSGVTAPDSYSYATDRKTRPPIPRPRVLDLAPLVLAL